MALDKKIMVAFFCLMLAMQVAAPVWFGVPIAWWVINTTIGGVAALVTGASVYASGGADPDGTSTLIIEMGSGTNAKTPTDAVFYWYDDSGDKEVAEFAEKGTLNGDLYTWKLKPVVLDFDDDDGDDGGQDGVVIAFKIGNSVYKILELDLTEWIETGKGISKWRVINWTMVPKGSSGVPDSAVIESNMTFNQGDNYQTIGEYGGFGYYQNDLGLLATDEFEVSKFTVSISKKFIDALVDARANGIPSVKIKGAEELAQGVHFKFFDEQDNLLREFSPGDKAVVLLPREKFKVKVENLPPTKDPTTNKAATAYRGYFGVKPKPDSLQPKIGNALPPAFPSRPVPHAVQTPFDLDPQKALEAFATGFCNSYPGQNDTFECTMEVETWEGDDTFESAGDEIKTLQVFSNHGSLPNYIEDTELWEVPIQFKSSTKKPMDFTLWQADVFGSPPLKANCGSAKASTESAPTCTLSPNLPFTIKFEHVSAAGDVYFNAAKIGGGGVFNNVIIVPEAGDKLDGILSNVYYIGDQMAAITQGPPRNEFAVTAPISLNQDVDDSVNKALTAANLQNVPAGLTGYYAVHNNPAASTTPNCPGGKSRGTTNAVVACEVKVDRIDGEYAWESVPGVNLFVFSDRKGSGEGKLEGEEMLTYYIQFKLPPYRPCTTILECLAEIDQKMIKYGAPPVSPLFEWGVVQKDPAPAKEDP